ncbi:hypothetical protein [Sphaerochaeta sp. PS]|uniref:hypothetical protein n=1 Tax=Sphaerochaeta sp. PS TaxID=3076336 RepID=UPI0028A57CA2|nr:hypothetical protein [Sphaerochaeta sp. PS]MDT4761967.1 hypothetical protein [Sphaerochaeta sp. PS]
MGTFQADILLKQKEIEGHRNDLFSLYAELGFSIAQIEQITPLGYAKEEFDQFVEVDQRYDEALQAFERVKGFISQLEDRSRKIQEIEADIRALKAPREKLFSRLGAIAYEAYGSDTLPDYLKETCSPFFSEHHASTQKLQASLESCSGRSGTLSRLQCSIIRARLHHLRKKILPSLVKAGSILATLGCEADLPGVGKGNLSGEIKQFLKKQQGLQQELDIHHSAVAKLRSQEKESPKNQLETSRVQVREIGKQRTKVSSLYGKALYEHLNQRVSAQLVGSASMALMEQISLHLRRVERLEQDIVSLQNLMKIEELEAQIELENQKIEHLRSQIESANKQISQVEYSIERKRGKISSLRPIQALSGNERE